MMNSLDEIYKRLKVLERHHSKCYLGHMACDPCYRFLVAMADLQNLKNKLNKLKLSAGETKQLEDFF